MTSSVNKVILLGNLGSDPEEKRFSDGDRLFVLSLATNASWKDKVSGAWREVTNWHRVVVRSGRYHSICENKLRKGCKLFVEGTLESRTWQSADGAKHYETEVVVRPFSGNLVLMKEAERTSSPAWVPDKDQSGRKFDDGDIPF